MGESVSYCPKCGASQKNSTNNKVDKAASNISGFLIVIGFLVGALGLILLVGSLIALAMKGPMEDPNTTRVWAIGQIFYMIFIPSGFIDSSLGIGFGCFVAGCILFFIGDKGSS